MLHRYILIFYGTSTLWKVPVPERKEKDAPKKQLVAKPSSKKTSKPEADVKDKKPRKMAKNAKEAKAEKGQPRTGAKANKEALEEIKRRLDNCIYREEFDKSQQGVQRAITSVTVFKTQMKIFE